MKRGVSLREMVFKIGIDVKALGVSSGWYMIARTSPNCICA